MTVIGSATTGRRIAVLAVGTPGSGAQAVARTLALLGAEPADRPEVVAAQEEFLQTIGSGWDDPLPLPETAFSGRPAKAFHDAVADLFEHDAPRRQILSLADPRLCVMLPLWRRVLDSAGILPLVVLPLRHPLAAAPALRAATGRPREAAPALWLAHMLAAERGSRGLRRLWLRYDGFVADPWAATRALIDRLACFSTGQLEQAAPAVERLWSMERAEYLAHEDDALPSWSRQAYDGFLAAATAGGEPDPVVLDALTADLAEASRLFGAWIDVPAQARRRIAGLEADLAEARAEADRRRDQAANREETARAVDMRRLEEQLARLEGENGRQRAEMARLTARLETGERDLARQQQSGEAGIAALGRILAGLYGKVTWGQRWGGLARALLRGRLRQRLAEDRDIALIARSGRFDVAYYIGRYPDVVASNADPIVHYVRCGAREGRNPHPQFDTRAYRAAYSDVGDANPLADCVRRGRPVPGPRR